MSRAPRAEACAPVGSSITLVPAPASWSGLLRASREVARVFTVDVPGFRSQLGLPAEGKLVMSGHQPGFWHPGITAKVFAASAAASAVGCSWAWLVPDQDTVDPSLVRVPVKDGQPPQLRAGIARFAPAAHAGTATASLPPLQRVAVPQLRGVALASAEEGLCSISASLRGVSAASTLAEQCTAAALSLLHRSTGAAMPSAVVYASGVSKTALFGDVVERMRRDPERVVRSYNRAASVVPGARLALLSSVPHQDLFELPLWRLKPGAPRRRVYAHDLAWVPIESLAPRALLLTGLMRLAGCDLFVHGTGGALYDRASEAWFRDWLGASLVPAPVATATLCLPLVQEGLFHGAAHAVWSAHHARHDPAVLGDTDAADAKARALQAIAAARAAGEPAKRHFRMLHKVLTAYRRTHRSRLDELSCAAARASAAQAGAPVAADRTWAFPLYDPSALRALDTEVRSAFGVEGV